jgi:predicted transcriptional regulator of viral defense system
MARSRFQNALTDIESFFEKRKKAVYTFTEIGKVLEDQRNFWKLPATMNTRKFLEALLERTKIKKIDFKFPSISIHRYTWGDTNIYEIVSGLLKNSYFCHYSALYLHELTEQIPRSIYLNYEQHAKPKSESQLTQQGINKAFSQPPRVSKNICIVDKYNFEIHLLNGMNTGKLGVVTKKQFSVTDLERTLIDIAVRPYYSGGVFEVLKAYKRAHEDLSVSRLSTLLNKIDYIYPYHQAVGFYLEKAGYSQPQLEVFENYKRDFDFYLTYQIEEAEYSSKWRIYYPKGL